MEEFYIMNKHLPILSFFILILSFVLIPLSSNAAQVHYVAPGESLHYIAQKYDISLPELIDHNTYLRFPHFLHPGQAIIIPQTHEPLVTHRVAPGETLYIISQNYDISLQELIDHNNNLSSFNKIYPGQEIFIPQEAVGQESPEAASVEPQYPTIYQLSRMYSSKFFLGGSSHESKIALTFDDGPDKTFTPKVLDVLNEYDVQATFFLMGENVEKYPEVTKRIASEGHTLGNHSWSHPDLRTLSEENLKQEIEYTSNMLRFITGIETALIRPPYGAISEEALIQLTNMNYYIINWNVDSKDWKEQGIDNILINTLTDTEEGSILLFHDGGGYRGKTVQALPTLIETLQAQGYEFVTVDELLNIPASR